MDRTANFRVKVEQKYKISISQAFDKFAEQGMSYHDVAAELEYSENTIRIWSKKTGIKLKPSTRDKRKEPAVSEPIKNALSQKWI